MTAGSLLRTRITELQAFARMARTAPRLLPRAPWSPSRLLTERVQHDGDRPAVLFEDQRLSWREVDRRVDGAARAFRAIGVRPGDTVALLMDNRPEFLAAITGLNRIGAGGALINTNITATALAHAIRISEPVAVLAGQEHCEKIERVLPEIETLAKDAVWIQGEAGACEAGPYRSFDALLAEHGDTPLADPHPPNVDERFGYIYTSGTTGLPKAAIIPNQRILMPGALLGRAILQLTRDDVVYISTPLYHSVGIIVGWGATLTTGATMALRRKFSASKFWDDVHRFDVTAFVYIGELCRYLLLQPEKPLERGHRLRIAAGNGLRPDIWETFQKRFDVPLIREYYGATEGNSMTINMTGRPGMIGRLMLGAKLIRCDLETGEPLRNAKGRCEAAKEGETGLYVAPISKAIPFDGYADRAASQKKVLGDVFAKGDRYFNSGDLMTLHEDGWVAFADRVGDTFRWKGENVSTNEVAEILNGAAGVLETNVYGVEVPGADGRAGMASVHCASDFSIEAFGHFVVDHLPGYQRPIFVRLQHEMRITVTLKHQKVDYRREGYDPTVVHDPLYLLEGERYIPLDADVWRSIQDGSRKIR